MVILDYIVYLFFWEEKNCLKKKIEILNFRYIEFFFIK